MAAHEACKRVLAELSADKLAVHFSVPVDTSALTDYLSVVASPIDLQTIGERLADALEEMPEADQVALLTRLDDERAADVLDHMEPDDAADLIAQLADRSYLEKCRSHLYREFELCGLAGKPRRKGPKPIYSSPDDLIRQTPKFVGQLFDERLDGYFGAVYRHAVPGGR